MSYVLRLMELNAITCCFIIFFFFKFFSNLAIKCCNLFSTSFYCTLFSFFMIIVFDYSLA